MQNRRNKMKRAGMVWVLAALCGLLGGGPAQAAEFPEEPAEDYPGRAQVIISGTKTEHTLASVPVLAEVVTREQMERQQVKTVQEALRYLAGVKINRTSSGWGDKGKVQMLGMDEKHTLILVDGQRFVGGHGDAVDLQSIPVALVERIEVVKGPASALYGSDALGGVVNIITRSDLPGATFSASPAFGSRGSQAHEVSGGARWGQLDGLLSYTHREADGVEKATDRYREDLFHGSFGYRFSPAAHLSVKPFYSEHGMSDKSRRQERAGVNALWDWAPDEVSKLSLRGSFFDYRHETGDQATSWDTDTYEGELTYSRPVFGRHLLTGGYQFLHEEIDDQGKAYAANQDLHSIYVQDEIDLHPWILVFGARVDHHDRWDTEVNPRFSMLYHASDKLRLRASVGTAFKGPSLVKLYGDGWRMGPRTVHANPDLEPEKSLGYQLGAEYQMAGGYLVKLALFRNEIDDLVASRIVGRDLYWENIDEAVTQGIEASLAGPLWRDATANLAYTFLDTENKATGRELTHRARHKVGIELNQHLPRIGLNINLAAEYYGRRYDSDYRKLGGYSVVNLALTQSIGKHLQLFGRIDNLLDKKAVQDEYDLDGLRLLCGLKVGF